MGNSNYEFKSNINRLVWMILFIGVSVVFVWMEWQKDNMSAAGWFLAAGMWSAVCGVGYSVCDWFVQDKSVSHTVVHTAEDASKAAEQASPKQDV